MDHAHESAGTAFLGGRVLTCTSCDVLELQDSDYAAVAEGRVLDVRFLLDRLTGPRPVWRHAGLIDHRRIGMAGHGVAAVRRPDRGDRPGLRGRVLRPPSARDSAAAAGRPGRGPPGGGVPPAITTARGSVSQWWASRWRSHAMNWRVSASWAAVRSCSPSWPGTLSGISTR